MVVRINISCVYVMYILLAVCKHFNGRKRVQNPANFYPRVLPLSITQFICTVLWLSL